MSTILNKDNTYIIEEYLQYHTYKNHSTNTIHNYKKLLYRFNEDVNKPFSLLEWDDVKTWLDINGSHLKPASWNKTLSILRSFFQYCVNKEYMKKVLVRSRWTKRIPEGLPKNLDRRELARLMLVVEKAQPRDRAIMEILASTGIRRSECSNIEVQNVDLSNRTISVGSMLQFRIVW